MWMTLSHSELKTSPMMDKDQVCHTSQRTTGIGFGILYSNLSQIYYALVLLFLCFPCFCPDASTKFVV